MSKGLIEVKVTGADKVQQSILELARRMPTRVMDALEVEANLTMEESQALVPVVTGALKSSRFVAKADMVGKDIGIVFGYGGPAAQYALAVHENPRAGKTGGVGPAPRFQRYKRWSRGGQWKYLEQPVLSRAAGFCERMRGYILREY